MKDLSAWKGWLASRMVRWGLARFAWEAMRILTRGHYIRVVNYHGVPSNQALRFSEQLTALKREFMPVDLSMLGEFLSGKLRLERPGLFLTFDDGLRSHAQTAAPILEKHGFRGLFFLPVAFLDTPPSDQPAFAASHQIDSDESFPDGRIALCWEEARELLRRRHAIGAHTLTHCRMHPFIDSATIEREIVEARRVIEERLGAPVDAFAWVGGEEENYHPLAQSAIQRAGYRYSFLTNSWPVRPKTNPYALERTHLEASWPLEWVRFQVSGWADLRYLPKRLRVARKLASASSMIVLQV